MIKVVVFSMWACAVMLGAGYSTARLRDQALSPSAKATKEAPAETRKLKELNVPKIRGGVVRGYIVVQINYIVRSDRVNAGGAFSDAIVADEVFRYLYDDDSINFEHLEKYDIKKMTATLIGSINGRLKADAVVDFAVQEFNFLPSQQEKRL